jgi:hypothetical protein
MQCCSSNIAKALRLGSTLHGGMGVGEHGLHVLKLVHVPDSLQAVPAAKVFCSWLGANARTFHSSSLLSQASKSVT